jgi:hypothetical protein
VHALLATLAASPAPLEEKSKTIYVVLGCCLVAFAIGVSAFGITRHDSFPPSKGALRGVLALAVLLVAGTMLTAVITS